MKITQTIGPIIARTFGASNVRPRRKQRAEDDGVSSREELYGDAFAADGTVHGSFPVGTGYATESTYTPNKL